MQKIYYINTLRLFVTFTVVLLHSSATYFHNGLYCENDYFAFAFYSVINSFAVPVFVLISGALFLNPKKDIGYRVLLTKYVKRIVLALVIFGLPMCFAERIFKGQKVGGVYGFANRAFVGTYVVFIYANRPVYVNSATKAICQHFI